MQLHLDTERRALASPQPLLHVEALARGVDLKQIQTRLGVTDNGHPDPSLGIRRPGR